ncbi:MAG: hypothetical protein Q9217_006967 [Psora testacea]
MAGTESISIARPDQIFQDVSTRQKKTFNLKPDATWPSDASKAWRRVSKLGPEGGSRQEGEEHNFQVAQGDNLLDIAQSEDLEMEGACGGSCACSTCHVIVESEDMYEKIPEPDDDENDMLDLAFGLTETSRLGCQVKMNRDLDGLRVRLPSMTRNLQASDFSGAKKS